MFESRHKPTALHALYSIFIYKRADGSERRAVCQQLRRLVFKAVVPNRGAIHTHPGVPPAYTYFNI